MPGEADQAGVRRVAGADVLGAVRQHRRLSGKQHQHQQPRPQPGDHGAQGHRRCWACFGLTPLPSESAAEHRECLFDNVALQVADDEDQPRRVIIVGHAASGQPRDSARAERNG